MTKHISLENLLLQNIYYDENKFGKPIIAKYILRQKII
jgi:hypothetical protein